MKYIYIFAIFIFFLGNCLCQNPKRGFKKLHDKEYNEAIEVFNKTISKEPSNIMAKIGKAIILAEPDYFRNNYFDAYKLLVRDVNPKISTLSEDDIELIVPYFDAKRIGRTHHPFKKRYDEFFQIIEYKLIKYVREEKDLNICKQFKADFPDSKYKQNIQHIINYLEFDKARTQNTIQAYQLFIKLFPDAAQVPQARNRINRLAFEEAQMKNTIEGYNEYIAAYPNADEALEAERLRNMLAFLDAKKKNTIVAMDEFMKNYPETKYQTDAQQIRRRLVFQRAKTINTLEAYNDFVKEYPYGKYFVDVIELKAKVLGKAFLKANADLNNITAWAKGFDKNMQDDEGGAVAMVDDGYILAGVTKKNKSRIKDIRVLKTDMNGSMIWDKCLNVPDVNRISYAAATAGNDIVVAGYLNQIGRASCRERVCHRV